MEINTDVQAGLELGTLCSRERCLNRSATAPRRLSVSLHKSGWNCFLNTGRLFVETIFRGALNRGGRLFEGGRLLKNQLFDKKQTKITAL